MFTRGLIAVVLTGIALLWVPSSAEAEPQPFDFEGLDNSERDLIKNGRIVVHHASQALGPVRLYGGKSWQRINAPPDAVWRALLDTPHYPDLLPRVSEARLVHNRNTERLVYLRHGGPLIGARYHLVLQRADESLILRFHVDPNRPGSLRHGRGSFVVRPYENGQSVVTFNILADFGGGMLTRVLRPQVQNGILRAPWTIKRYIEGRGRTRYLSS